MLDSERSLFLKDTSQSRIPSITVVTVSYNHALYLGRYIESLRESRYPISQIVVVDNASMDDSTAVLKKYPEVELIVNTSNLGYSAGLNQAFRRASNSLVCATGPDIVVDPDWLSGLVDIYQTDPKNIFAVGSVALTENGSVINSAGSSLHFTGHLSVYAMWMPNNEVTSALYLSKPREVDAISSTSMLVDREKFLELGGCDEDFFIYHEEFDYCFRAKMKGWKCWIQPNSIVYHGTGTIDYSVREKGAYPKNRPFYHNRNRFLSIIKNFQLRTIICIIPILIPLELLNILILYKLGSIKSYWYALCWLWEYRNEIIVNRGKIQRLRLLDDGAILSSPKLTITPVVINSHVLRAGQSILDHGLKIYWNILRKTLY